jgi:hypothetical protein
MDTENPEKGPEYEAAQSPIEILHHGLGFQESKELQEIRRETVLMLRIAPEHLAKEALSNYLRYGEKVVAQQEDYIRAQIGLILATALIYRDAGKGEHYTEALMDALEYAANMGFDEEADIIRTELNREQ